MSYLVTGAAGFIGFHLTSELLKNGIPVCGLDNLNSYYDVKLKQARIDELNKISTYHDIPFECIVDNLEKEEVIEEAFKKSNPEKVINLAGQAGVRYSIKNPYAYASSNLIGFLNILEACRRYSVKHLIYASSSSVYGGNKKLPFSEDDAVDHPVSLYAATKKSNELMAHSYSHLYGIPTTGLRFFTVYGPWGRPDMAPFLFTKAILNNQPIKVFNNGDMLRDFTYIDDITTSLLKIIEKIPKSNKSIESKCQSSSSSWCPYKIFNIGNSSPIKLMEFINAIEKSTGKKAKKEFLPMQKGDVKETFADTSSLEEWINFKPNTSIIAGVEKTIDWYMKFYEYSF